MEAASARYKKLKQRIQKLGVVIPGTLRSVYKGCGKSYCKCASGEKKDQHGPYLYWDRKINDKLSSRSIKAQHKKFFQTGIKNRKEFEKIRREILALGEKISNIVNTQ